MAKKILSQPGKKARSKKASTSHATRGMGYPERSKSGGAVKGRIPKAGGHNSRNFVTGVGVSKAGKDK